MQSIPVNDIKKPVRITVSTRNQMLMVIRGAHHIRDAIEIYFDGVESIYYICAMDDLNIEIRKMVLSRVAGLLQRNTPINFNAKLKEKQDKIPKRIFREVVV